ncbi:MAG: hypothetical protein ACOYOA_02870 [Saprospiraceae bacterium]
MGNESFDKKIKDKFDQFEPEFQEEDWNNFNPLLRAQSVWWNRSRKTIAYAAAIAAVLLLTFQNFNLSIENKHLQSNIEKISEENRNRKTSEKADSQRDTIYIIKEKYVFPESLTFNKGKEAEKSSITAQSQDSSMVEEFVPIKSENSKFKAAQNRVLVEKADAETKNTAQLASNSGEKENARQHLLPTAAIGLIAVPSAVSSIKKVVIAQVEENVQLPELKRKASKSPNTTVGIGLASSLRDDYTAVGLSALLSYRKHFQLSTGLQFGKGRQETFRDNDAFKDRHKVDFRNKFDQPIAPNVKFTDIKSSIRQWIVPISLSYQFPLYRWLSAYSGLGTFVELNTTQKYEFQYSETGIRPRKGNLPVQQSVLKLQKFTFHAGLQADIQSFCLRIEPVVIFNAKNNMDEHRNRTEIGINTHMLYRF